MTSNGKGSIRRGASAKERARYEAGWARIFGKKPKKNKVKT